MTDPNVVFLDQVRKQLITPHSIKEHNNIQAYSKGNHVGITRRWRSNTLLIKTPRKHLQTYTVNDDMSN